MTPMSRAPAPLVRLLPCPTDPLARFGSGPMGIGPILERAFVLARSDECVNISDVRKRVARRGLLNTGPHAADAPQAAEGLETPVLAVGDGPGVLRLFLAA